MSRSIIHLDADAFFASVEQASDPRLRGKPIAVGGEKRGIIASASYEARRFGVYTPMPTVRARKLCPSLIVLPGDFERYEQFSKWMFGYAEDFTPEVERASIDEGYFDVTGSRKPAREVAETIRRAIGQSLKITVSEGIASNKLVSSIASKVRKPAAFVEVLEGEETEFLHPLGNKWLPGIGPKASERLNAAGLVSIGQVADTPLELLTLLLGNAASGVREFARGVDARPVVATQVAAKSYSQQETFPQDVTDEEYLEAVLRRMADELMAKVREDEKAVRTLTVKVRYNDMAEDQRSESLLEPTDLETDIYGRLQMMLRQAWKRRVSLRLVSLRLSNVYDRWWRMELPLEDEQQKREELGRLVRVVDDLRRTFGPRVIGRGHDLRLREAPRPVEQAALPPRQAVRYPQRRGRTFIPLNVHSVYSFLDSTLTPSAIVDWAAKHDLPAVALTDTGNLHGVVEFVHAAKKAGIKPLVGAEIHVDGKPLLLYVQNAQGYGNLCQLLTRLNAASSGETEGETVARRQQRSLLQKEIEGCTDGLLAVGEPGWHTALFHGRFYPVVRSRQQASQGGAPGVLAPRVHYAVAADRRKYDIIQSIRTRTLLGHPHPEKRLGGAYHFRRGGELPSWSAEFPGLLETGRELTERCEFHYPFGPPQFPSYQAPGGMKSHDFLRQLVMAGLRERYGARAGVMQGQIEEELGIIAAVGYEDYFLLVWDLLQECRAQGIEWITRGSAADSLVCYCLRISDVCPIRFDLYFQRFLNRERMALNKLPDIDIDFPHDRKDDVVELIFAKYGREFCAVVGGFSTFQARSAFAEVAKVLGMAEREVRRITEHFPWSFGGGWVPEASASGEKPSLMKLLSASPECADLPLQEEPCRTALEMSEFLDGLPRHPKMHPCGVVVSGLRMLELTPTFSAKNGWPTTHLDMDAVEEAGLIKLDVLAQGGLAVMRDARASLAGRGIAVDLASLEPWDDPVVWEMIASGGGRGVHHVESPAMVSLCRMTNVREIDGLIAIVSVIRPGAANENKKQSFTRRYQGMEPVVYPHPSLESCLRSTYGLVVYEEHILQICQAFAGLPSGRADVLRRALNKHKRETIEEIRQEFFASSHQRGHTPEKTVEVWDAVSGFAGYAFCKAHSTAYGVEAYQAAWLKCYYPAEFMAGVLSNGKGFYSTLVYVLECLRLGLAFLPPSINEPGPAFIPQGCNIRVPATRAKGLTERTKQALVKEHARSEFTSLADFFHRVHPMADEIEALVRVGAFDLFGASRTAQFWECQYLIQTYGQSHAGKQPWLLPPPTMAHLPSVPLEEPSLQQRLEWEMDLLDFTVSDHPLALFGDIAWETYCPVAQLGDYVGQRVVTCGLIIEQRTHHQVTGEPMKFLTLADRTGIVETELFAQTYRTYGLATVRYPVLEIEATVEPFENGHGYSLRVHRAGKPRITNV